MKGPGIRWSTVLVVLVACGGRAAHPAEHTGGAGSGGSEAIGKVGDDQGGTGGSSATGGNAIGGERSSGGTDTSGGSANAGNSGRGGTGGSGGASGNAGNDGGGHGGAGGQGGVLMTPEVLVPIANAFCGAARSCCKNDRPPRPLDHCESSYGVNDPTSQALASGTITLDSAGLAGCLTAYEAAAETCEQTGVLTACRGLVHGTLAEGQSCRFNSECAGVEPMVCLRPEDAKSASVCKKIVHGKAGDACVVDCYSESNAVYGVTGAICVQGAYAATDASPTGCFETEGTYCDTSSIQSPQCRPIRATGAACTSPEQCGSAADCDAQTRKCRAFNETCGGCPPLLRCVDGKCQGRPFTAGGTCAGTSYGP